MPLQPPIAVRGQTNVITASPLAVRVTDLAEYDDPGRRGRIGRGQLWVKRGRGRRGARRRLWRGREYWRGRDDRGGGRFRRTASAAGVAGGLPHGERVADVFGDRYVGLAGGGGDGGAAFALAVAAQPLVGVGGGAVRPGAVLLAQRLTLLGAARDRSGAPVLTGAGGTTTAVANDCCRAARAAGVARGLLHADRVADVFGDRFVGLAGGAGDRRRSLRLCRRTAATGMRSRWGCSSTSRAARSASGPAGRCP